jgi:hypothetical protein|tara:strand:- start:278 stop:550 length:273 start_codon:yes stop_codon:yes gene_type:complete
MTYLPPPPFFDVGIFADTLHNIDLFSSNIYLTQMLSGSLEQYARLQEEYEGAVDTNNEELMEQTALELKICEGNFAMATAMFDYWEKVYS